MSSLISETRLQRAQDEYLQKLEDNYQQERKEQENMRNVTIQMCVRIQRFFRRKMKEYRTRYAVKVQLWWKGKMSVKDKQKQLIRRLREIIAGVKIFNWLQLCTKQRKIREKFALQQHAIVSRVYTKQQLVKLKLLQAFFAARYRMRKSYLQYLIKKKVVARIAKKRLAQDTLRDVSMVAGELFKHHAATMSAFETEVKFIENTLAYNQFAYCVKWDEYQESLSRFMKGRNKNEDYIEQRTPLGARVWTNIKTMEQTTVNPVDKCLDANVSALRAGAQTEFMKRNEYLENARTDLQMQKADFQRTYLSLLERSF